MVEWKKLGDICEIKGRIGFRGYTREDQVDKGEGAISLSPGNITDGSLNFDSCTYITWEKYDESPEIMVSEGDIILGKTASVGKVARIKELPEKATINPQLVLIKNITINPQYLFYVLSDSPFQKTIKGLAGVGSVPNVSQAKLSQILIPVPNPSEQERIEKLLNTFTSSIDNLKQQIAQRRKQYEYYRDQLLDLEGKEGVEMKISDFCLLKAGKSISANKIFENRIGNVFPCIGGNGIRGYVSSYSHEGSYPVIGRQGALCGCVNWIAGKFYATEHAVVATGKKNTDQRFLYYLFENADLNQYKTQGAQPGLSVAKLNEVKFLIPSLSEQQRIVSILDTFEASIQNLEAQLSQREKQYEYYRNKLLTFE